MAAQNFSASRGVPEIARRFAPRSLPAVPYLLQYYGRPHERRDAEVPSPRAVLAVRRPAGSADRGGAYRARSGSLRSAVWRPAAAVLDHARLSRARRAGFLARPGTGAGLGRIPRNRIRRGAPLSSALLVERRGPPPRAVPDRRAVRRHRSADRRSTGALCPRAVAAARVVSAAAVIADAARL